jgi:hypothetical protein
VVRVLTGCLIVYGRGAPGPDQGIAGHGAAKLRPNETRSGAELPRRAGLSFAHAYPFKRRSEPLPVPSFRGLSRATLPKTVEPADAHSARVMCQMPRYTRSSNIFCNVGRIATIRRASAALVIPPPAAKLRPGDLLARPLPARRCRSPGVPPRFFTLSRRGALWTAAIKPSPARSSRGAWERSHRLRR